MLKETEDFKIAQPETYGGPNGDIAAAILVLANAVNNVADKLDVIGNANNSSSAEMRYAIKDGFANLNHAIARVAL